jgi:hypothetical protein
MGLLSKLLTFPISAPVAGVQFSLETVERVVRDELVDDRAIKEELMELQLALDEGDIDGEEYVRREAELMQRFREVRYWRERFGMGVTGGPVRVQHDAEENG